MLMLNLLKPALRIIKQDLRAHLIVHQPREADHAKVNTKNHTGFGGLAFVVTAGTVAGHFILRRS
jgi:hypothetical protein